MHSRRTFTVSRERAKPASRAMNPACMKKTRKAVTRTQMVFTGFTSSLAVWTTWVVDAPAWASKYQANPFMRPSNEAMPAIFPPNRTRKSRRVSCSLNPDSLILRSCVLIMVAKGRWALCRVCQRGITEALHLPDVNLSAVGGLHRSSP